LAAWPYSGEDLMREDVITKLVTLFAEWPLEEEGQDATRELMAAIDPTPDEFLEAQRRQHEIALAEVKHLDSLDVQRKRPN
jgi:hypothetical protein